MAGRSRSSGLLSAGTNNVVGRTSTISGVTAISDSTNVATVTVYDNASGAASGTILAKVNATVNTGSNSIALVTPIRAEYGIVVVVSGTGTPQGIVYYEA